MCSKDSDTYLRELKYFGIKENIADSLSRYSYNKDLSNGRLAQREAAILVSYYNSIPLSADAVAERAELPVEKPRSFKAP